jgi:hypothetical protein
MKFFFTLMSDGLVRVFVVAIAHRIEAYEP